MAEVKQGLSEFPFRSHEDLLQQCKPIDRSVIPSNEEPGGSGESNSVYETSDNLENLREGLGRSSSSLNRFLQTLPKGLGSYRQQQHKEEDDEAKEFEPRWRFETIARIVWQIKRIRHRAHSRRDLVLHHRTTVKNALLVENREEGERKTKRYVS